MESWRDERHVARFRIKYTNAMLCLSKHATIVQYYNIQPPVQPQMLLVQMRVSSINAPYP